MINLFTTRQKCIQPRAEMRPLCIFGLDLYPYGKTHTHYNPGALISTDLPKCAFYLRAKHFAPVINARKPFEKNQHVKCKPTIDLSRI